jgi:hypothetical protein
MPMFRYIGKAPARPDGTMMFRVKAARFEIVFPRDAPFEIPDDGTPARAFVLKCIRGHHEYDWDTKGQIKAYEEIVE